MINITTDTIEQATIVDSIVRLAIPNVLGVSSGAYGSIIHLPGGASAGDQTIAQSLLDNYNSLTVTVDKTVMNEGDADPIISCNDGAIVADSNVYYVTLLDGEFYASGTDTVTAGLAQLTLSSPVVGVYETFIYRNNDTFASGSITITVNEI